MIKVVLLTNSIPPYRVDFFRELSELCDFTVVCDLLQSPLREWKQDPENFGFDYIEIGNNAKEYTHKRPDAGFNEQRVRYKSKGVIKVLKELKPEVVVTCEFGMRTIYTLFYSMRACVPYIIWSEGTRFTEKSVKRLKFTLRNVLARGAKGYWTNGVASRNYLEDLGATRSTITEGMTGIATDTYRKASKELEGQRDSLRVNYGIEGFCFLFIGAISERKGVMQLLEALELSDAELRVKCTFIFAGSGPLQEEAEARTKKFKNIKVFYPGFVDQEEVQQLFAVSDMFVMPTLDDNWPLVTIEAMVSGLPQIGSIFNGASEDLAQKCELGTFIDPNDVTRLASLITVAAIEKPDRLSESLIDWATDFYSPQNQAQRAIKLISSLHTL